MKPGSGIASDFEWQSTPRSAFDSQTSNKYTDTPREHRPSAVEDGDRQKQPTGQISEDENSFASGHRPVNWFSVAPDSEYEVSVHDAQSRSQLQKDKGEESALMVDYKAGEDQAVQRITLMFKDRVPGSSKRVSAGSQDRQTATRDESSRLAEQKDISHDCKKAKERTASWRLGGVAPCFSFLTHSDLMMDRSHPELSDKVDALDRQASRSVRPLLTMKKKTKPELEIETTPIEIKTHDVEIFRPSTHSSQKTASYDEDADPCHENNALYRSYLRFSMKEESQSIKLPTLERSSKIADKEKRLKKEIRSLFEPPSRTLNLKKLLSKPTT